MLWIRIALLCVLTTVVHVVFCAEPAASKPVVLLTGFEPFGGSPFNTSWDTVSPFEGREIAGHVIHTAKLQVVYDAIGGPLAEAIEKHKPDVVISFGEGSTNIRIETIARNGYNTAHPRDNKNNPPPRESIVPGGTDTIPTGLPVDAIVQKLRDANMKVDTSTNAGGYLCNECFYRLMTIQNAPKIRGFIHVPVVPPKNEARRKQLRDAVEIMVTAAIESAKMK